MDSRLAALDSKYRAHLRGSLAYAIRCKSRQSRGCRPVDGNLNSLTKTTAECLGKKPLLELMDEFLSLFRVLNLQCGAWFDRRWRVKRPASTSQVAIAPWRVREDIKLVPTWQGIFGRAWDSEVLLPLAREPRLAHHVRGLARPGS
jgi:hypothetical protein